MRIFPTYTVDQEFTELGNLGFTGTLNDRQFKYLRSLQYTGTLTDMFFKYRFDPYTNYKLDGRLPSLLADFKNNVFATRPLDVNDYSLSGVAAALVTNFRDNAYLTGGLEQMTAYTRDGLITSGRSTTMIVRDEDGIYKHGAHNLVDTRLDDSGEWTQTNLASVTSDGVGAKGKERFAVIEDTSTDNHQLQDYPSFVSGRTYTIAVDAAPIGSRDLEIVLGSTAFGASVRWLFDLSAGTVTRTVGGTNDSARMIPLGNGEYRCELTIDATATSGANVFYRVYNGAASYTGDGASGLYLSRPIVYESSVGTRPELVTNGTFASDIAGWTDASDAGGAISWNASGYMDLVYTSGVVRARQSFAVVSGKRYRVTVERISGGVNSAFYVGSSSGAGDIVSQALNTAGVYVFDVTATTSTFHIDVRLFSAGTATVDNISVIPIPDAMQPASDGEKWIPNETGAALYAAPVDYDVNGVRSMPIFEARTNLLLRSAEFDDAAWSNSWGGGVTLTANDAVAPDGTTSAEKFQQIDSVGDGVSQSLSGMTIDGIYTVSCFIKNIDATRTTINLYNNSANEIVGVNWSGASVSSITTSGSNISDADYEDVGDGWIRLYATVQVKATTGFFILTPENLTVSAGLGAYFWGAQLEAGLGASPYIPTYGSTATRAADNLYTLVSSFGYRQTEGTVVAEFESVGSDGADFPSIAFLHDGSADNRIALNLTTGNGVYADARVGAVGQMGIGLGSYTPNGQSKAALGTKQDSFAGSLDGATVATDSSGSHPSGITTLQYGRSDTGQHLNGKLYSLVYYPFRASNADLEAASA